jgi:DNA-binding NarL/FixJ family response regulator
MSQVSPDLIGEAAHAGVAGLVHRRSEPVPPEQTGMVIAVIDPRTLDRECLVRILAASSPDRTVIGYASIDACLQDDDVEPWIILYRDGRGASDDGGLGRLVREAGRIPVMVIGESENVTEMINAFDKGAKGYIPSSVGLETIVDATRMSLANGVFLPMTSLQALRSAFTGGSRAEPDLAGRFTDRQLAVCQALRRGKSNKLIAYELNLCESTVKVHIRTIMKKLRAANRTEAAFKLNTVCFAGEA